MEKEKNKVCIICKKEIDHQTYSREGDGWAHIQCQPPTKPMRFDGEIDLKQYRKEYETRRKINE